MSTEIKLVRVDEVADLVQRLVAEALEARGGAAPAPQSPDAPEFLSIKSASRRFDISEHTLRNWILRGQLTKYKIHDSVRLKVSEIEKLLVKS